VRLRGIEVTDEYLDDVRRFMRLKGIAYGWIIRSREARCAPYEGEDDPSVMERFIEKRRQAVLSLKAH
jgi:hypothetical protein